MAYQIEYAYTCHIGKVRNNNEDNFWCCGESLDSENKGMSHVCSGHIKQADLPLLAVFDGMGGESCGEMAAFLAAESCGQYYKEKKKEFSEDPEQFMNGLCSTMNHAVCHICENHNRRITKQYDLASCTCTIVDNIIEST